MNFSSPSFFFWGRKKTGITFFGVDFIYFLGGPRGRGFHFIFGEKREKFSDRTGSRRRKVFHKSSLRLSLLFHSLSLSLRLFCPLLIRGNFQSSFFIIFRIFGPSVFPG